MKIHVVFLALMCATSSIGCGADDDDDAGGGGGGSGGGFVAPNPANRCAERTGAYTIKFTEKSGNCGPLEDQIVTPTTQADPLCQDNAVPSSDPCVETSNATCDTGQNTSSRIVGQVRWDASGNSAVGTYQLTITDLTDGSVLCQSTYDVRATR
jgi:hypothetical protein